MYDIQLQTQIEEEHEIKRTELEEIKIQNKEKELQKTLNLLEKELEEKRKQNEFMELTKQLSTLENDVQRFKGIVEAEIIERKHLAEVAGEVKLREVFLNALPNILVEANRPIEKMGEIKTINFSGFSNNAEQQNPIVGILSSFSSLHIFKEVMNFINELISHEENKKES